MEKLQLITLKLLITLPRLHLKKPQKYFIKLGLSEPGKGIVLASFLLHNKHFI